MGSQKSRYKETHVVLVTRMSPKLTWPCNPLWPNIHLAFQGISFGQQERWTWGLMEVGTNPQLFFKALGGWEL